MKVILFVGLGSFLGGITRFLIGQFFIAKSNSNFPFGTFFVNLLGCFLIGLLYGFAEKLNWSTEIRSFLLVGLLGGFTTFSAFSNESIQLLNNGAYIPAIVYISLSIVLGLVLTFLGLILAK